MISLFWPPQLFSGKSKPIANWEGRLGFVFIVYCFCVVFNKQTPSFRLIPIETNVLSPSWLQGRNLEVARANINA